MLADAEPGRIATIHLMVREIRGGSGPRAPTRIRCGDGTAEIDLVYFNAGRDWLQRTFPAGREIVASGRIDLFNDRPQMVHPDAVVPPAEMESLLRVEPTYPLTAGLQTRTLAKALTAALEKLPDLPEWLDPALAQQRSWPSWREALAATHNPATPEDLEATAPARMRLAYDELLASQLALAIARMHFRRRRGRSIAGDGQLRDAVAKALPFALTGSQVQSLAEISADLESGERTLRLLQGDVGSGKTVVALMAMMIAVEASLQAALLAPTELLARQHAETLRRLAAPAGIAVELLTGRDRGSRRNSILLGLADGSIPIVAGTHALLSEGVAFRDLGLIVIDEQHRFGVHQRLALSAKGSAPDMLVMTATPIPRTLQLTAYGDMDVSRLTDKPPGRTPVDTRAVPADRLEDIIEAVGRRLDQGHQVYWVCPAVEEAAELVDVTTRHGQLTERFGSKVGLVHGKLPGPDKDAAMARFVSGETRLLVATTVIEVGVDVPAASVIVIEQAERYGLAQLHQLRGRVGRGDRAASCLLVYQPPLGETERKRLSTIRATDDGFVIAEEDLRLRGAGELLGTRQSGLPRLRLADLAAHNELLAVARDDAKLIIERDPQLDGPRGEALRILLYLFERDAAVRTVVSG